MGHEVAIVTTEKHSFDGHLNLLINNNDLANVRVKEVPYWPFTVKENTVTIYNNSPAGTPRPSPFITFQKERVRMLRKTIGSLGDIHDFWIYPALKAAQELYNEWKYDVIVSTYSPPATHVIASKLKKKHGRLFWVADFRDLWYGNHLSSAKGVFGVIENRYERHFLKRADMLTTVSNPLNIYIKKRYPNKEVYTCENGFDVEDQINVPEPNYFPDDSKIRLVYTGTIYAGKQDPSPLFAAIDELKKQGIHISEKLEVLFYGSNLGNLFELVQKYDLNEVVKTPGFVDRKTVLHIQKSADALIFLEWEDPSIDGILTGKLFEYFYSGTPILGVGVTTNTLPGQLIEQSGTGVALGRDVSSIYFILLNLINQKGMCYNPNVNLLRNYTREEQARRLLDKIISI